MIQMINAGKVMDVLYCSVQTILSIGLSMLCTGVDNNYWHKHENTFLNKFHDTFHGKFGDKFGVTSNSW
jgi:hypothetical protein